MLCHEQQPGQAASRKTWMQVLARQGRPLLVERDGRRAVLPMHGASKEPGKGLWRAILKQLGLEEEE
jgi:predicted RNA binding protein YcfA (HicA-like mRNA interferase family)